MAHILVSEYCYIFYGKKTKDMFLHTMDVLWLALHMMLLKCEFRSQEIKIHGYLKDVDKHNYTYLLNYYSKQNHDDNERSTNLKLKNDKTHN